MNWYESGMKSLVIKGSGKHEKYNQPWELVFRTFEGIEVEYNHICYLNDNQAMDMVQVSNNAIRWLYGEPDWEARYRAREIEKARRLKEEAEAILKSLPPEQRILGE
jgi:hypothetical protein